MENLIDIFSRCAKNPSTNGTLTNIFLNKLNDQQTIKRKNYFAVVDICDPLQTYFKFKYPEIFKHSIETKKKFSLGNRQHKIIGKKIEKIEGFFDKEVVLDGELLSIPLKGRADAKVNNSFWEIKSKPELPQDKKELIEKYPQDIEQLCFYSILDPGKPLENYLIFTTHLNSNNYKIFKIKIIDFGKIKNLALNRIYSLNKWLDEKSPENCLKCRYCYEDCIFKEKEFCTFYKNKMLPCEVEKFIEIEEAPEIEKILSNMALSKIEKEGGSYSIYNLITPRKIIHKENEDIEEEDYDGSEKYSNKQLIQDLIYKLNYNISLEDFKFLEESKRIKEIFQNKTSFIKLIFNGSETIFPILIHISESPYPSSLNKVSPYKKGELGIHCLNNKANKGYIISFFPKQNNELRIFELNYDFNKEDLKKLKNMIEILKENDKNKINELPMCPEFIHNKKCVYKEFCPIK